MPFCPLHPWVSWHPFLSSAPVLMKVLHIKLTDHLKKLERHQMSGAELKTVQTRRKGSARLRGCALTRKRHKFALRIKKDFTSRSGKDLGERWFTLNTYRRRANEIIWVQKGRCWGVGHKPREVLIRSRAAVGDLCVGHISQRKLIDWRATGVASGAVSVVL